MYLVSTLSCGSPVSLPDHFTIWLGEFLFFKERFLNQAASVNDKTDCIKDTTLKKTHSVRSGRWVCCVSPELSVVWWTLQVHVRLTSVSCGWNRIQTKSLSYNKRFTDDKTDETCRSGVSSSPSAAGWSGSWRSSRTSSAPFALVPVWTLYHIILLL